METKICNKCEEEKSVCEFGILKSSKDGFRYFCKVCRKKIEKNYEGDNVKKRKKKWRDNNKEKIKKHYLETKESVLNYQKKYREENEEKILESKKKYYNENKDVILLKTKIYRKKNKQKRNSLEKNKKKNDKIYQLLTGMRSRLSTYLKKQNITKRNRTFEIIGCSPEFLKEHLEKQFISGMTWENRNEWHIDHIIPLSSAKTEEELYKLCHYTNLQPLCAEDNIKKSNKIVEQFNNKKK
jgi:hypothetical protein